MITLGANKKRQRYENIFDLTVSYISSELSKLDKITQLKENEEISEELQNQEIISGIIERSETIFPYIIEYLKQAIQDEALLEGAMEMLHLFSSLEKFTPRLVEEVDVLNSLLLSALKNNEESSLNMSALSALYNFAKSNQVVNLFNNRENDIIARLLAFQYYMEEEAFWYISFILARVSSHKIYAEIFLEKISAIIKLANSYDNLSTTEETISITKNFVVVFYNLSLSDEGKAEILGNTMAMMWLYQQRELLKNANRLYFEALLSDAIKNCETKALESIPHDIANYKDTSQTFYLNENNSFIRINKSNDSLNC